MKGDFTKEEKIRSTRMPFPDPFSIPLIIVGIGSLASISFERLLPQIIIHTKKSLLIMQLQEVGFQAFCQSLYIELLKSII
tara:strand:+ start:2622 stop:2864 length:243 start_codon:yes stop_codon:yes gene_type:complete